MRTPQAQIENASPSTVTRDNSTFFSGSNTDVLEISTEEATSQLQTENEFDSNINNQEYLNEEQIEINSEDQEPLELTVGTDDFINDLENRSANLPTQETSSNNEQPSEVPRRGQRVPNDLDELRALQDHPPEVEQTVNLNTERLSGITASYNELSPSEIGRTAPQFNSATQAAFENEITTVESELPVMDQPTGLEPGERPLQQMVPAPLQRTPEIEQNQDQGSVQTEIEPTPEPLPAQAHSPILRPTNEQELERAMEGLQIETQVNTNLGDPPEIDLTGQADPNQVEREQQRNNNILRQTELEEINGFRRDFGENDVYPSIPTEELSSNQELTAASNAPILETEHSFPPVLESDEELLNEDLREQFDTERTQVTNESQIASEEFESNRTIELENGLNTIRNEEYNATEEQIRVREQNANNIARHRADHERESEEIISEYENDVDQQRQEHDSDLEEEFNSTMDAAESMFDDTEGEVSERERLAAERVAQQRREAEQAESERSWLDEAIDAVTDFFNDLINAVTQIIDDLRAAVKDLFDAVKARVVALIDTARNVIVGMIRSFGNLLIEISNRALSRFPELRDRVNGLINDTMDWAEQRVNEIAEQLKSTIIAALDFIANAIDSLLAVYQAIIVTVLEFYKQFTIGVLRMAHQFYEYLMNTILQIATLVAFVAIMNLGTIFLSTAWHFIGRQTKERLVDAFLGVIIELFEAAPDEFDQGFLWPLYVNMQLGYFYEIYNWDMDTKIAYYDKLAGLLISPSFWWNFLLGIFVGIWDNIWGMIEGIWMLIRFIFYDLWVLIDRVIDMLMDIAPDVVALIEQLNTDIRAFITELKTTGREKLEQLKNNLSRENIEAFFDDLEDDLKVRAQVLGGRMAEQGRDFMLRDDAYATIGYAVGRLTGYLLVEILLAVFTVGIGTAIKWGLKGVKVAVRIAKMLGSVGRAGGFFSRIIRFFSKGAKWLMKAITKFAEKVASIAKGLLRRFKTIFENLSRKIDDIVARLRGRGPRRPARSPHPNGPNRPPRNPRNSRRNNRDQRNRQDTRLWRQFRIAATSHFQAFNNSEGLTERRAKTELRAVIRRHHRIAKLPFNAIEKDKGWLKIHAIKKRVVVNRKRYLTKVPLKKRERWLQGKTAIILRMERIRVNQINEGGLRQILLPYKNDYKYRYLRPEWDQREHDWNIMGGMSPEGQLTEVSKDQEIYEEFKENLERALGALENLRNPTHRTLIRNKGLSKDEVQEAIDSQFNTKEQNVMENPDIQLAGRRYNISVDMKNISPRQRRPAHISALPTGSSRREPILLRWYRAPYNRITNLGVRNSRRNNTRFWDNTHQPTGAPGARFSLDPHQQTPLAVPKSLWNNRKLSPTPGAPAYFGLNDRNIYKQVTLTRRSIVKRTRSSTRRGSGVRSFKALMRHYGKRRFSGHQIDHAKDLGYSGGDNLGNLWPLATSKNQGTSREMTSQRVHYREGNNRRIGSPSPGPMIGKWFKIVEVTVI